MLSPLQELLDDGLAAIERICAERREETLHLEFKTLSASSGTILKWDDRRLIAKALSGMSNAKGGVIVLGNL